MLAKLSLLIPFQFQLKKEELAKIKLGCLG